MINQSVEKVGYKNTKLGWIPDEWEVDLIKNSFLLINGKAFKPKDWKESGIPIIRIQNLNNKNASFNYYDGEVEEKYHVIEGDLLFAWSGSIGISFGARVWDGSKAYLNQHIFKVLSRPKVDDSFALFILLMVQRNIERRAHGFKSSFVHVKKSELEKTLLPLPPLPEQQKIATILSTWDKAIGKLNQLIEAKEKQKKGLMQRLLTGKVRFSEFVKNVTTFKTKYGDYPVDWTYPKLEGIAKGISVKNKGGKNLPVLSCTKHRGLVDSLQYFGKRIYSKDTSVYKIVSRGQFAYATNHIEEGSIGYQDIYDEALISPMYTAFETNKSVNDFYLFKLLKTPLYIHIYQANTSASVDRRGSLRWKAFSQIHIPLPPLEEQNKIAKVIAKAEVEINVLNNKLDFLKQQKKGLMQQLLTGKTRVKI